MSVQPRPWFGTMRRAVSAAVACALITLTAVGPARAMTGTAAVLRGLDKVTARTTILQAPVGEAVRFGTLVITARVCDKRPPEETPESAAYLEIIDERPGQPAREVFHGWMFASSPGLSALQHPVYDVWVLDCEVSADSAPSSAPEAGSQ